MEIALEDIKLRVFIDTNVLIDCFVTPDQPTINYLKAASDHGLVDLVTSDYALWEKNEFIRKQVWIKYLIENNRSHKEALNYKISPDRDLMEKVSKAIEDANTKRDEFNILNYNLMDVATSSQDFFEFLVKLTSYSNISNQDLLMILSAYVTHSRAIFTRDGRFNTGFSSVASLEETLGKALIPDTLKNIKFINKLNTPIDHHYADWFDVNFREKSIGKCVKFFGEPNVIVLECLAELNVNVGDYLMLIKIETDKKIRKVVFRVTTSNLNDYKTKTPVESGNNVSIKLDEDIKANRWMENSLVFKIIDD